MAITANATDNVGVSSVVFSVDGQAVGTDTTAPYSVSWNADAAGLGAHTISATAYDTSGNLSTSTAVTVTVVDRTSPTVTITRPTNGSTVSRSSTVTIAATATDTRGVARVVFYVNNVLRCTDTGSPYSCTWPVPSQRNVRYALRARAYDAAGNFSDVSVSVTSR